MDFTLKTKIKSCTETEKRIKKFLKETKPMYSEQDKYLYCIECEQIVGVKFCDCFKEQHKLIKISRNDLITEMMYKHILK